jgi:hypothetical protein
MCPLIPSVRECFFSLCVSVLSDITQKHEYSSVKSVSWGRSRVLAFCLAMDFWSAQVASIYDVTTNDIFSVLCFVLLRLSAQLRLFSFPLFTYYPFSVLSSSFFFPSFMAFPSLIPFFSLLPLFFSVIFSSYFLFLLHCYVLGIYMFWV